jgi:hypothetical protein
MRDKYLDHYNIDSLPHLRRAAKCKSEYFITSNEDMIEDRDELEIRFNIKIRTPSEILEEFK